MNLYVDTCVLPRCALETGRIYRERFGSSLGFELLMMFDLPNFEENLKNNLNLFAEGPLLFHEPVWGVDHAAKRGTPIWTQGMYHLRLTKKYAEILHPAAMIVHLSNGPVPPALKNRMLRNALKNLEEMLEMFPATQLLTENTGLRRDGTQLLDQTEFTDLCREKPMKFYSIAGVGADCALQNTAGAIEWRTLPAAKEIEYSLVLDGKNVESASHRGILTQVSTDGKHGMMRSEDLLQPLQNLMLRLGSQEAYAKVTKCSKQGNRISFTSVPGSFSELIG